MTTRKAIAKKGAIAATSSIAPEVVLPLEMLAGAISGRREKTEASAQLQGDVVLVPPPDRTLFLELRKQRVNVVVRKGVRIVVVEPAKGLTAAETIAVGTLLAAGYGAYEVAKWLGVEFRQIEKATNPFDWLNPSTWKL